MLSNVSTTFSIRSIIAMSLFSNWIELWKLGSSIFPYTIRLCAVRRVSISKPAYTWCHGSKKGLVHLTNEHKQTIACRPHETPNNCLLIIAVLAFEWKCGGCTNTPCGVRNSRTSGSWGSTSRSCSSTAYHPLLEAKFVSSAGAHSYVRSINFAFFNGLSLEENGIKSRHHHLTCLRWLPIATFSNRRRQSQVPCCGPEQPFSLQLTMEPQTKIYPSKDALKISSAFSN
jgi:hypothetical protein